MVYRGVEEQQLSSREVNRHRPRPLIRDHPPPPAQNQPPRVILLRLLLLLRASSSLHHHPPSSCELTALTAAVAGRMQEQLLHAAEPGRRPAGQQFVGVDLRRPKGYAAPAQQQVAATAVGVAEGSACPRCESRDTKFCYYNNYNTSQPRYFCKCCRRYWTKGGTLRNVPVGGGTRKKPSSSSSSSSSPSSASAPAAKRHKTSKKRVVAAPPATFADNDVVAAPPDSAKTTDTTKKTATPPTDAASEITTELVVPAADQEDSFTDLLKQGDDDNALALDLGFSDYPTAGLTLKQLGDTDSFEWPPAFDLNPYWSSTGAGFADPDPGVFMNLP